MACSVLLREGQFRASTPAVGSTRLAVVDVPLVAAEVADWRMEVVVTVCVAVMNIVET